MLSLYQLLQYSTVKIIPGEGRAWGTGFFITSGQIITCAHVVQEHEVGGIQVFWQGQVRIASAEQILPSPVDLALLRIESFDVEPPPCALLDETFAPFDRMYVYGYPDDFPDGGSVTVQCEGDVRDKGTILIKAQAGQIRPGHSGSPVLNKETGKVCGIVSETRGRSNDLGGLIIPVSVLFLHFPEIKIENYKVHEKNKYWIGSLDRGEIPLIPVLSTELRQDWGEAPDVPAFFGRIKELGVLQDWILQDKCRVVMISGMGGIGKTGLSVKLGKGGVGKTDLSVVLAKEIKNEFSYIIWRSLLNAPPIEKILVDIIQFVSNYKETHIPGNNIEEQISKLIYYLNCNRCLLILDNVETILQLNDQAGGYRKGYEGYAKFFAGVGSSSHQSCLLMTGREKPINISNMSGQRKPVRILELGGLDYESGKQIFEGIGDFSGSEENWKELIDFYDGNPLALELTAHHISKVYFGNISLFLKQGNQVFKRLKDLLDWHFERLSEREREVVYWLAINREATSFTDLQADILSSESKKLLPDTLYSLQEKIPLERKFKAGSFTLQPVLIEYCTNLLIELSCNELISGTAKLLNSHALIKTTVREYIREQQVRLILDPISQWLKDNVKELKSQLSLFIKKYQGYTFPKKSYTSGNIINLLIHLKANLSEYDFSYTYISQAYLQGTTLHKVDFSCSEFSNCAFTNTLNMVLSVALNLEGNLLAAGDANGRIYLWNVDDEKQLFTFEGHDNWVQAVAFDPKSTLLVSGSEDLKVKLWDISNGHCIQTLDGHKGRLRSALFSPDGRTLATSSDDGSIKLWDVGTGECYKTFIGHESRVWSIAFSPDGGTLASGSIDQTVKLWDVHTGELLRSLHQHTKGVYSVTYSPDGTLLASGSADNTIKIWNSSTGECIQTLHGHRDIVLSVTFTLSSVTLASSSCDSEIKIWDIPKGECKQTLLGHKGLVYTLGFVSKKDLLVSGGYDNSIKFWDIYTGRCLKTWQGYNSSVTSLSSINNNPSLLCSGHDDNNLRLWNIETGQILKTLEGHESEVKSVDFCTSKKILASGSFDRSLKIWNIESGQCLLTLRKHSSGIRQVRFSPNAEILASCGNDQTINLWNIDRSTLLHTFVGHSDWVWSIDFSPDNQILASSSSDRTIKLWYCSSGENFRTLQGHSGWVTSVVFINGGKLLVSSSDDHTIKIWNIKTGECIKTLCGHKSGIWQIAINAEEKILASAGDDKTVRLWDLQDGSCLRVLEGHNSRVWAVTFSQNEELLISGSRDETIKIWSLRTGKCIYTMQPERPYEGTKIIGSIGLTEAQKHTLKRLGAVVNEE